MISFIRTTLSEEPPRTVADAKLDSPAPLRERKVAIRQPREYRSSTNVSEIIADASASTRASTHWTCRPSAFWRATAVTQNVFDHEQGSVFSHQTEYRDVQNNSSMCADCVL